MRTVFFFRGLSTYGSDHAKWAFFDFGPMYGRIVRAMRDRDIQLIPVMGMGTGSLAEVSERAVDFLRAHEIWRDENRPVHIMAHSAGGLAARRALHQLGSRKNLRGLLTVATPHRGSHLAQICVEMPERAPASARLLKIFGYDLASRREFFTELTIDHVNATFKDECFLFNKASIVCAAPPARWSPPMKLIHRLGAVRDLTPPSDGIIERTSQPYGEILGEICLDHFQQVGLFGGRPEFTRMCDLSAGFFKREPSEVRR